MLVFALASTAIAPAVVCAQTAPGASVHRAVGLGAAGGVGARAFAAAYPFSSGQGENVEVDLPRLHLAFSLGGDMALEVSIPVVDTIVGATFPAVVWGSSFFVTWLLGGPNGYLVVGPGLGYDFSYFERWTGDSRPFAGTRTVVGADVRVTGVVGLELLTDDRFFAFRLVARPWITFGGGDLGAQIDGGAMLDLVLLGFVG